LLKGKKKDLVEKRKEREKAQERRGGARRVRPGFRARFGTVVVSWGRTTKTHDLEGGRGTE